MGWPHPHGWLPPLSYIYVGHTPLLPTLWFFPSPAKLLPQIRLGLAKLCRIVSSSFTHLEKSVLECPADPFFRCPAGPRAWRSRRRAVRVTEHGGAATCGAVYTIL